ncbi:MAG: hypothetical protein ACKO0Z_03570 [Betaproteobacteria bacterium]
MNITEKIMETEIDIESADAIAAICGGCQRTVFLAVTARLEKGDHKEIGMLAARGCEIKHMAVSEARKVAFGCKCKK